MAGERRHAVVTHVRLLQAVRPDGGKEVSAAGHKDSSVHRGRTDHAELKWNFNWKKHGNTNQSVPSSRPRVNRHLDSQSENSGMQE